MPYLKSGKRSKGWWFGLGETEEAKVKAAKEDKTLWEVKRNGKEKFPGGSFVGFYVGDMLPFWVGNDERLVVKQVKVPKRLAPKPVAKGARK